VRRPRPPTPSHSFSPPQSTPASAPPPARGKYQRGLVSALYAIEVTSTLGRYFFALEKFGRLNGNLAAVAVRAHLAVELRTRRFAPLSSCRPALLTRLCGCQFAELFLVAVGSNDR
jgi:hypothetical protein